ncbi:MAG: hypothetical protein RLZZ524_1499 [Pseudomonadota bacterium]
MKMTEKLPPLIQADDRVILFDGVCKLCSAWSKFIIRHDVDRRFKLASVQSDEGRAILAHFGYPTDFYETMLVVEGNRCFEKSRAFFVVMSRLRYPWRMFICLDMLPRVLSDWLYDRIALNRYELFGKYSYCALPTPDHEARFLKGK